MGALFHQVLGWYMVHITYWTVFLLMVIESTFLPFPSEAIIPPAAFKAASGDMNIFLIIFAGSMGAIVGSLFNYYLAKLLGRRLLLKFVNTRLAHLIMMINRQSRKQRSTSLITENFHLNRTADSGHSSPDFNTCRVGQYEDS